MKVEVLLGEAPVAPADVADRVVAVIDVLRAATTAAQALTNGARALIPFESVDEAAQRARLMDQDAVRLGGERRMVRVEGFDFGNSPLEYTSELVSGRTIVFTTSNGTVALTATHGARDCFFAGFVNVKATIDAMLVDAGAGTDFTIVCAGTDRHIALEDVVCAGRIVRGIREAFPDATVGDGALLAQTIERPYQNSVASLAEEATHARALRVAGFGADVDLALSVDALPVAVRYSDRQLRALSAVTD